MFDLQRNPFAPPTISWTRGLTWAVGVNALLGAAVLWSFSVSRGADNPLALYIGLILQFPGSLLFNVVLRVAKAFTASYLASIAVAATVVAFVQVALLTLVIRKPWRR